MSYYTSIIRHCPSLSSPVISVNSSELPAYSATRHPTIRQTTAGQAITYCSSLVPSNGALPFANNHRSNLNIQTAEVGFAIHEVDTSYHDRTSSWEGIAREAPGQAGSRLKTCTPEVHGMHRIHAVYLINYVYRLNAPSPCCIRLYSPVWKVIRASSSESRSIGLQAGVAS